MARVLLVGLEDFQIRRLAPALEDAGFDAVRAPDEPGAPGKMGSYSPDLILLGLPATGEGIGKDLAPRRDLGVPLLAIAPWAASERIRLEALEGGADDCVSEPVELGELVARVQAILRRYRQRATASALVADQAAAKVEITLGVGTGGRSLWARYWSRALGVARGLAVGPTEVPARAALAAVWHAVLRSWLSRGLAEDLTPGSRRPNSQAAGPGQALSRRS